MDDIKLSGEDHPLLCTSVQHIVDEHKDKSSFEFDKNKKKKKDGKIREKMVAHTKHESIIDKQETEEKRPRIYESEDQCGNIVDVEA